MTLPTVLIAHNRYQQPGGEDQVFEAERALLARHGHRVITYEVHNDAVRDLSTTQLAAATVWNGRSYGAIRSLIRRERPDYAHFHNTFPLLSPAVYYAARREGVPVVQTLHNYRLLCPNAMLFRDGHPCHDCVGRLVAWPGVRHRCYRHSAGASAGVAALIGVHRLLRTWRHAVDVFVTMTPFGRDRFVEAGLAADQIIVKPHFLDPDPGMGTADDPHVLYVGRLAEEKGIRVLLDAWNMLETAPPLRILGDGPLAGLVRERAARHGGIEILGWRPVDEVLEAMKRARLLVVPSIWYETFGLVIIQAFATGVPVLASDLGAMASLVRHGENGLRFRAGDPADLARQVRWALSRPAELATIRSQARREYEELFTADRNYAALMEVYATAARRAQRTDRRRAG